ncbi:hypothetical protein OAC89_04040 [Deltaproteobacteria bacterium]|nr:hypothetical protein [Deltaproteobacteria bacterium]
MISQQGQRVRLPPPPPVFVRNKEKNEGCHGEALKVKPGNHPDGYGKKGAQISHGPGEFQSVKLVTRVVLFGYFVL